MLVAALFAVVTSACYEAPPPKEAKAGVDANALQGKLRHRSMLLTSQSNFRDPSLRVITDIDTWDEAWRSGWGGLRGAPQQQPDVNFDDEMVILVAMGTRPRGGYQIKVDSVVAGADLAIYVSNVEPGGACKTLERITAPAQIVTVPQIDKPVRFEEQRQITSC
jgi:hypothetical protein